MFQVGTQIQDKQFIKAFSQYENMANTIQTSKSLETTNDAYIPVPKNFPANKIFILEYKNVKCISFSTSGGVPGLRGGYLYIPDEKDIPVIQKLWKLRPIKPNWYAFYM